MDPPPEGFRAEFVRLEEELRRSEAMLSEGRPAGSVRLISDRCLSLGVAQRPLPPSAERARAEGIPLVRRSTGGTGVLLERGDIAWSLVLPLGDMRLGRQYTRDYRGLGGFVVEALSTSIPALAWGAPLGLSEESCLLGSRGSVLAAEGRVLGGAAQHRTARALLHHGVVHYRIDPGRHARLFLLPEGLVARHMAGAADLGASEPPERLAGRIRARLGERLRGIPGALPD